MKDLKKALKTRFEFYKEFKNEINQGLAEYVNTYNRLNENVKLNR